MKITNLWVGIVSALFGILLIVVFNEYITKALTLLDSEWQIVAYITWVLLCFIIGVYAPIGTSVEDS